MEVNLSQLQQAINDAFTNTLAFEQFLQGMNRQWSDFAGIGTTLPQGIMQVITVANKQNWLPSFLDALARSAYAKNPQVRQFFVDHPNLDPAHAPPPVNPFVSTFLHAYRPFVGRPRLRTNLPRLGGLNESRVLLVDGPRWSGKSYTSTFLQFMAMHKPCDVVYFDLDLQPFTLERFAKDLQDRLKIGRPFPNRDNEQLSRWAERIADWIIRNTATGAQTIWIVIDGFRVHVHEQGVYDLIDKIGEMIDNTAAAQSGHLRLILLNYASRIPETVAASALEDTVEPPGRDAFEAAFLTVLVAKGHTQEDATAAFQQIYEQAESKARQDSEGMTSLIKYLNMAVTIAIKRLGAQ